KVITCRRPVIAEHLQWGGGGLFVNKTVLSPVSSCTLLCMAVHTKANEAQTQQSM
ncbi:unnamed protein product, partial [Staurois parvus]